MAKDFEFGSDIRTDMVSDTSDDNVGKDLNGDLASNEGLDLNASENKDMANKTLMSCEATLPEDYTSMDISSPDSAYYTEAPDHVGRTPEQIAAEMGATIQDGDPAPDNRDIAEQPSLDPEYGDHDD